MTQPEPAPPRPKSIGRFVVWGIVLGAVLVPIAVFGVMEILNETVLECRDGGAEGALACVLRQVVITAMAIPVGAVVGYFISYWLGTRRR